MGTRRKFSAEYKREAVAMLDAPGVTVSQSPPNWASGPMCWGAGDGRSAVSHRRPLWATGEPGMKS